MKIGRKVCAVMFVSTRTDQKSIAQGSGQVAVTGVWICERAWARVRSLKHGFIFAF